MPKASSAGLLMYRVTDGQLEVLLVHLGGPFWKKKDEGAWTFPRGEVAEGEELFQAAVREFFEETGLVPEGPYCELGCVRQKSGKLVYAWAFAGSCDPGRIRSNTFELEWPPCSGKYQFFPEIDRAQFFGLDRAKQKILAAERPFLTRLAETVSGSPLQ